MCICHCVYKSDVCQLRIPFYSSTFSFLRVDHSITTSMPQVPTASIPEWQIPIHFSVGLIILVLGFLIIIYTKVILLLLVRHGNR